MTDVQKYGNTVLPIGSIVTISSFRSSSKYEVVGVVENSTKTFGKEYEVYELKADRSGVKGKRQNIVFPYPQTTTRNTYYVQLPEPNKALISQKEIDSENRRSTESEVKLELEGVKPTYLMTKDEYKKDVTPKFKEFNKFIEKNIQYFSKDTYWGIEYMDWKTYSDNYIVKGRYDSAESSFKSNWGRKYEGLDIKQASDELINKLNEYLDYFKSIFGDKNIKLIESDESTSNKRSIKRAIDDGTYEKLLRDGVINYSFLKNIFDSVGLKIPTKLEKVEKEVVELGLTTDVVKDREENNLNFLNDLKEKFKIELNEYKDYFFKNYYTAIKNIYEYSQLNKNIEYKNIDDFYVKYSEYKGIVLIPKYKYRKTFKGQTEQIFIGYENLHSDTTTLQSSGLRIISFNENKVVVNSDWENILNKAATEYANNLFETFGNRVLLEISIINEIPKISHGYIKDLTQKGFEAYLDLVYKNGFILNIETQVIYAGGINIQVLHLRGLFKTRNAGKFISNDELIKLYNEFNPIDDLDKQEMYAKKLEDGDEKEFDKISIKEEKNEGRVYEAEMLNMKKIQRINNIKDVESLIELTEESLKDNSDDEDLKLYLESLKDTLENLKSEKLEEGGSIKGMKLIKKDKYTAIAGGNMGTVSRKYVAGEKNTYSYLHYTIEEYIPRSDLKQDQNKLYVVKGFKNDFNLPDNTALAYSPTINHTEYSFKNNIDWNKVKEFEELGYNQMIEKVKNTDISNALDYIKKNELFLKLVEYNIKNENKKPYIAYIEVIRDFYKSAIPSIFSIEVIANIAMKKGMEINSLDDIKNIVYKKYDNGGSIIENNEKNNMNTMLKLINDTVFYRYYHINATPFEVSIDNINKYGKGIYFLDNPYFYQDKFKDGMLIKIKPNLKNPKFYIEGSDITPNADYSAEIIDSLKNNIKNRNEFSDKLIKAGYDSIVVVEPRGIYLVMLYNDPDNYEIISDKKNVMAIGGEIKPLDFVSESITNSIEELITKGNYGDLTLVEALFFYKAFNDMPYGKGRFLSKDGLKGAVVKRLIDTNYIDESWLVYYGESDDFEVSDDNYSPTEKGLDFLKSIENRHQTRIGLKDGTDLFSENANIKEYDERISKNKEKLDKLIATIPTGVDSSYKDGGSIREFNLREIKSESTDRKKVLSDLDGNLYLYELQGSKDPIWVLYNANVVSKSPYIEKGTAHRMSKIKVNIID